MRQLATAAVDPARLATVERLRPVGLLGSIRVLPWMVVPGYRDLICQLRDRFGLGDDGVDVARDGPPTRPGASVVGFPYDFRLGVAEAACRLQREVVARLGPRRVIVLAHSMGGLVARYWLGPLGGAGYCRALITLGTPHRGAPKALDLLLNGVRLGPRPVAGMTSRLLRGAAEVVRGWPSTYDLLPRYRAVRDEDSGGECYPHELPAERSFQRQATAAFGMHREIEDAWGRLDPAERPDVLALFARGHATPSRAVLRAGRVSVTRTDAEWLPNVGWGGDGTVPAISAYPIELDDEPLTRRAVPDRHLPLATTTAAVKALGEYEAESTQAVCRGDTPEGPWLGLDLDEVICAGEPFPVSAELCGTEDVDGASAWLWVTAEAPGPPTRLPMTGADGRWHATVPGLAPGRYRVKVELVNLPRVDQLDNGDVIGVIEP
ncbi:MAG TPA: hypothetical protein VFQ77_11970 [Pseudonocardiaceae bacterium]|nr:hypothetical protein [Pseudonocardiaceae bacterium]